VRTAPDCRPAHSPFGGVDRVQPRQRSGMPRPSSRNGQSKRNVPGVLGRLRTTTNHRGAALDEGNR
jgi:hypothetical protein